MNLNHSIKLYILAGLCLIIVSCQDAEQEKAPQKEIKHYSGLENVPVNLPDSTGYILFTRSCRICHSLRYIQMQPDFPRKTWEKIVDKMRKNYGAPLSDSAAGLVVDYLVKIKGKK